MRGWRFIGFGPAFDRASAIEAPLAEGGIIEEAVRTQGPVSKGSAVPGAAPGLADVPDGCEMFAVPVTVGGQVVAALYADQQGVAREEPSPRFSWRSALEMMARHAARCLEGITAIRTAQLVTDARRRGEAQRAALANDEDAARRYAKLLVSEIKLYHGAEVAAGRRDRDLGTRLGGEIARARTLYEQRVPAQARAAADYFHEELVRTLAEGDDRLLQS
jgi:hypothetical protein